MMKSAAIFIYTIYTQTCFHGYIQKYMFIRRKKASSYTGNYSIKSTRYILLVNRVSVIQLTEQSTSFDKNTNKGYRMYLDAIQKQLKFNSLKKKVFWLSPLFKYQAKTNIAVARFSDIQDAALIWLATSCLMFPFHNKQCFCPRRVFGIYNWANVCERWSQTPLTILE